MAVTSEDWVKAGTPTDPPVTSSTPAPDPTPAAPAAEPAAASASPAAPAAPAPASAGEAAGAAAAAAAQAGASPAEQAAAAQQAADDFILGRVGNTEFKIPKNLELPWKRGNESGFTPIGEIQADGMRSKDYTQKTMALAEERRQFELNRRAELAKVEAEKQWLAEERERQMKAFSSPEEQAQYEAFLERYRNDPYFKKYVDDARDGRIRAAVDTAVESYHAEEALVTEANAIADAVREIGAKYPGIDHNEVMRAYGRDLEANQVEISRQAIESYFTREQANREKFTAPIRGEMEALKQQVAALTEQLKAAAHNDTTRQAMARTQNPVGAPAGGAPAAPSTAAANLKGNTLPDRSREWSRIR